MSTEEYKRSASEELMHCDYNKTESVIINYNSARQIFNKLEY
jgi:hypothetical protein